MTDPFTGKKPASLHLDFIGCRLNQAEIEGLGEQFAAAGMTVSSDPASADLIIFNSCAVTADACKSSRRWIRAAHRANPGAAIVVTGCYAHLDAEILRRLPGVNAVFSNEEKEQIATWVMGEEAATPATPLPPGTLRRTRAFIKAQDGCDNRCTYCVTRLARGRGKSRDAASIVSEIARVTTAGYHEAVLTGVHLGSYGADRGEGHTLPHLIQRILGETGIARLRLSSLEPWDIAADLFELWEDPRLCPHLHLPLQSGSGKILKAMARRTTPASFAALADSARKAIPNLSLTTDVMVGFPGEGDAEFAESLAFCEEVEFSRLHVFPFSPRPGTVAASMDHQVPDDIKKARRDQMRALSDHLWQGFITSQDGLTEEVLWENGSRLEDGRARWYGHTPNFAPVTIETAEELHNTLRRTLLSATPGSSLTGTLQTDTQKEGGSGDADL